MQAHKIQITVPKSHQITFAIPDDFPEGPAEVVILSASSPPKKIVKLSCALSPDIPPPLDHDPIADSLNELREERNLRFEKDFS